MTLVDNQGPERRKGSRGAWVHGRSRSPCGLELRLDAVLKMGVVGYEGREHPNPGLLQGITASIISASCQGVRIVIEGKAVHGPELYYFSNWLSLIASSCDDCFCKDKRR